MELVREALVGGGFFDRVQIFALDVLDQRDLEQLRLVAGRTSLTTTGHRERPARCAARQRRSPAMISIAVAGRAARRSAG